MAGFDVLNWVETPKKVENKSSAPTCTPNMELGTRTQWNTPIWKWKRGWPTVGTDPQQFWIPPGRYCEQPLVRGWDAHLHSAPLTFPRRNSQPPALRGPWFCSLGAPSFLTNLLSYISKGIWSPWGAELEFLLLLFTLLLQAGSFLAYTILLKY